MQGKLILCESLLPMTFKQLLSQYNWPNIEATLLQIQPDSQAQLRAYERVYLSLLLMPETVSDLQISVLPTAEYQLGHANVSGFKQTPHITDAQLSIPYSLAFTPWAQWLAMPVSAKSFRYFSETEIIAHCLLTMTSNGFTNEQVQAKAYALNQNISTSQHQANQNDGFFVSWDQIIRFLNSEK